MDWSLIGPLCKKWSRNRDSDVERVNEIHEYYNKGCYVPCIIHLACLHDEGLVCYDGNHRRDVFNMCVASGDKVTCIIDVMFDATQNEVYKAFNNINKSVQVPAIYLDDSSENSNIKNDILSLVRTYEIKYKSYVSTSSRCHAPHFNRDNFVDNLYEIYKIMNGTCTVQSIAVALEKLNVEYSRQNICRPHSSYKQNVLDKCKKQNLWLFLERNISAEHVQRMMM